MDRNNCAMRADAPVGLKTIGKSADRSGLPGEMDGLENDLTKLGALISELRGRLENVLLGEMPQPAGISTPPPPQRNRCNLASGIDSFRDRVKNNQRVIQDVLDRLDL